MKATDFDLSKDLKLDPSSGMALFRNSRLVIMDAAALGLLRQNLVEALGPEQARAFFLRFGYSHGFNDFMEMKKRYTFDSEMDLLASGPVIHSWEGIVSARPKEIRFDRKTGEFYFTGTWVNSYEAEQYLTFNPPASEPVCWSLTGYASGWCTAFFERPLLAMEPECAGRGDENCGWLIQPPSAWGDAAKGVLTALKPLMGE
jgi:rsbT co-antagonist protein RsbR